MPSSGVQTCARSEEHTSELQSHDNLVCRLLLEKKNEPSHCGRNDGRDGELHAEYEWRRVRALGENRIAGNSTSSRQFFKALQTRGFFLIIGGPPSSPH